MCELKNSYEICEDYVAIHLKSKERDDLVSYIDLDDLDKILKYKVSWNASWRENTKSYYATATEYLGMQEGRPRYKILYLHRLIFDNPHKSIKIDHVFHKTLDNRKVNLRPSDNTKNNQHRKGRNKNNTSGYRNVCFFNGKYIVQLQIDGKNTCLGKFNDVKEAVAFAEEMRKKYYGEFSGNSK
jgi:hypothetical protein